MASDAARNSLYMRASLTVEEMRRAWPSLIDAADRPDLRPQFAALLAQMNTFRLAITCPPARDEDTQPLTPVES